MEPQRVFVDANVFVSKTLRDWLFKLRFETVGTMFQIYSSEDVLAETVHSRRRSNPKAAGGVITSLRRQLEGSIDHLVADFDASVPYTGPDTDDLHVHAAAIACGADILLTNDSGFFNLPDDGDALPYEAFHTDDFFLLVDDSSPSSVLAVTQSEIKYWNSMGKVPGLVERLSKADCPQFAERVGGHIATLSGPVGRARHRELLTRQQGHLPKTATQGAPRTH